MENRTKPSVSIHSISQICKCVRWIVAHCTKWLNVQLKTADSIHLVVNWLVITYYTEPSRNSGYLLRCLKASYITTAAATEAFSEVILPFMGINDMESHLFFTNADNPFPSLPMTIAVGSLKSTLL